MELCKTVYLPSQISYKENKMNSQTKRYLESGRVSSTGAVSPRGRGVPPSLYVDVFSGLEALLSLSFWGFQGGALCDRSDFISDSW